MKTMTDPLRYYLSGGQSRSYTFLRLAILYSIRRTTGGSETTWSCLKIDSVVVNVESFYKSIENQNQEQKRFLPLYGSFTCFPNLLPGFIPARGDISEDNYVKKKNNTRPKSLHLHLVRSPFQSGRYFLQISHNTTNIMLPVLFP